VDRSRNPLGIAFAVHRLEVEFDQQLASDTAYGETINRLSESWEWLNVKRNFLKSSEYQKSTLFNSNDLTAAEFIFVDWLKRILIKFLKSKNQYLIILNSSLYLPDSFEQTVLGLIQSIEKPILGISIWPTAPIGSLASGNDNELLEATGLSKLGFLLTQIASKELLQALEINPVLNFQDSIRKSKITCLTISDKHPERPYLWLDIVDSEESHATKLSKNDEHIDFESEPSRSNKEVQVHAFISHWFSTWHNINDVENACLAAQYKTSVLNTTEIDQAGWLNAVPISFFRQFEKACREFDQSADYLLLITADVVSNEWNEFFNYCEKVLVLNSIGTLSPTLTNEFFHIGRFSNLYFDQELPLSIVHCNDLIVTYIERQAIIEMISFFDFFNSAKETFEPKVGFGLMEILRIIIESLELVNIRDRSFTLLHPGGSSYSREVAMQERESIYEIARRFMGDTNRVWSTNRELKPPNFDLNDVINEVKNFR